MAGFDEVEYMYGADSVERRLCDINEFTDCNCVFHERMREAGGFLEMDACEECLAEPGDLHRDGCFYSSCLVCHRNFGWSNLGGRNCLKSHEPESGAHTGTRYSFKELALAHERNWFSAPAPHTPGWVDVDGSTPDCAPDVDRVHAQLHGPGERLRRAVNAVRFAVEVRRISRGCAARRVLESKLPTELAAHVVLFYRGPPFWKPC